MGVKLRKRNSTLWYKIGSCLHYSVMDAVLMNEFSKGDSNPWLLLNHVGPGLNPNQNATCLFSYEY